MRLSYRLFSALWLVSGLAVFSAGCGASRPPQAFLPPVTTVTPPGPEKSPMVTHTVAPKETLWSISKHYGVTLPELMRVNSLKKSNEIPVGMTLLIPNPLTPSPGGKLPLPSIPLYPNPRWDYILVHHSATATGNASFLDKVHRRRGFTNGLGYHFVVDNGTMGKRDGEIEIGHRWKKQMHGAHCNAGGMNYRGIGICLVGDFTDHSTSQAQMDSLVGLVKQLQRYYRIPNSHVIRHKDVRGKRTACPGDRFPWNEFKRRLNRAS